ncbi:Mov34/MPN/PAD-1 family protein [Sphingomonas montana]|uniref:Mov34/MPN/PAD-1 family protein n=1 Tax=Sphingomonas montana TaxID=1843236 RepID=UPI001F0A214F|nr:Mov34/MPN/PAD-1 family protein [Sphingomonas montana]
MAMRVEIATGLIAELLALAAADPDREVCGILYGTPSGTDPRIDGYTVAANVAADPTTAFELDPAALFAAHRAARADGPAIVGCYHSHPRGPATPSARDIAGAEPGQFWLILAGTDARLYHRDHDGDFGACTTS